MLEADLGWIVGWKKESFIGHEFLRAQKALSFEIFEQLGGEQGLTDAFFSAVVGIIALIALISVILLIAIVPVMIYNIRRFREQEAQR